MPTGRQHRLSPREQALFMTKHQLSQTKWSGLRKALGGKDSGLASWEVIRSPMRTATAEPGRQVWTDAREAHLVSLRDAVECTLDELVQSEHFRERYVRGPDGRPVPHTSTYLPTPELPYEQHADNVADVHLCLWLDKGGRGASTAKLVVTTPNQVYPMSRSHSILLSTMPCSSDFNKDLHEMIGPWMGDVQALLESGVTVNGLLRAVCLFLTGDLQFLRCFLGHKGASCRLPCVWCLVVGRRGDANVEALAAFGDIQDARQKPKRLRTRKQLQYTIEALGEDCNDDLLIPLTPLEHLSIEYPPLLDVEPCQIVVAPLHLTLGVTAILLRLGVEAAALCDGLPAARRAAAAIGAALFKDVRVRPVPYHGGGFAGRESHRMEVRGSIVCDTLEGLIPAQQLAALRTAWAAWAGVARTLNRAEEIPAGEVSEFFLALERFVPDLQVIFSWLSVSPKLHALTHHAPTFLRRFGSLGSYAEQALEACHACLQQSASTVHCGLVFGVVRPAGAAGCAGAPAVGAEDPEQRANAQVGRRRGAQGQVALRRPAASEQVQPSSDGSRRPQGAS